MLQAEIGSAKVTIAGSFPTRGHLMPDFTLSSSVGKQVSLYDCRGRSNLALFFVGRARDSAEDPLLSTLPTRYREIMDTLHCRNPHHVTSSAPALIGRSRVCVGGTLVR